MAIDPERYRQESREAWGRMAPRWAERREWFMGVTGLVNDRLVEMAAPQPGQTFLDVAAGTGAPEMVEAARAFGESRRLGNVEYRVLDAEHMDLEDGSVDGVVSRWGYMLVPDPVAAFGEARRVLREGGPFAFAVWKGADRNPWAAVPGMTLVQRGHMPPPQPGGPGIFSMGDPERIRTPVTEGGFGEVEIEEIEFAFVFDSFDQMWEMLSRLSPTAAIVSGLPPEEGEATREAIKQGMAPFRGADGSYAAPAATWVVLAR
jgi:SAM-dependent methyltransferase